MIRLQLGLGHAIRCDELLHMSKQLQGQRTYFFPGGAFLIGCEELILFTRCTQLKNYLQPLDSFRLWMT